MRRLRMMRHQWFSFCPSCSHTAITFWIMNVSNWSPTLRVYCLHIRTELPWDEGRQISLLRFASFIQSHFVLSHSPLSSQLCAVDPLNTPHIHSPSSQPSRINMKVLNSVGGDRQISVTAHMMMMCVCETSGVNAPERKKVMLCVVEWWNCTKNASPCCLLDGMRWCGGRFIHSNAMGGE